MIHIPKWNEMKIGKKIPRSDQIKSNDYLSSIY